MSSLQRVALAGHGPQTDHEPVPWSAKGSSGAAPAWEVQVRETGAACRRPSANSAGLNQLWRRQDVRMQRAHSRCERFPISQERPHAALHWLEWTASGSPL
jgi:hypothetical protein